MIVADRSVTPSTTTGAPFSSVGPTPETPSVIVGWSTNGAAFDSTPLCSVGGVPISVGCSTCALWMPARKPAGSATSICVSLT